MNRKMMIVALLAVLAVVVLVVVSAGAVFVVGGDSAVQTDGISVEAAAEVAPVQVEHVSRSQVIEPAPHENLLYTSNRGSGCPYHSAKQQLTQVPAEKVEDQSLAQVGQ